MAEPILIDKTIIYLILFHYGIISFVKLYDAFITKFLKCSIESFTGPVEFSSNMIESN